MKLQIPVRQLWNFKAFSRRKDLSQMLHLYLYSWSGYLKHKQTERELLSSSIIQTPLKLWFHLLCSCCACTICAALNSPSG